MWISQSCCCDCQSNQQREDFVENAHNCLLRE
jgi:hypothetical protein